MTLMVAITLSVGALVCFSGRGFGPLVVESCVAALHPASNSKLIQTATASVMAEA